MDPPLDIKRVLEYKKKNLQGEELPFGAVAQKHENRFKMAPWMEPKTKTCGLPWLFNFEPQPFGEDPWIVVLLFFKAYFQ